MNNLKVEKVVKDGDPISKEIVSKWNIEKNCIVANGQYRVNFVGFILKKNAIFLSFPKHYNHGGMSDNELLVIMKKIVEVIFRNRSSVGSSDIGDKDEFPVLAYKNILNYYKKYGIYHSYRKFTKTGYQGKINWKKTIANSNKVIQENGIIFFPFINNIKKREHVFLSECMKFVFAEVFNEYREILNNLLPFKYDNISYNFANYQKTYIELNIIKNRYFKDTEKALINSLIMYFHWKSSNKNNFKMITSKFDIYWEQMINRYLNGKFSGYANNKIIWGDNSNKFVFESKHENLETNNTKNSPGYNGRSFSITLDHYCMDKDNKVIYVFDSKYYTDITSLNYKQLVYHYHMKENYKDYEVINGLFIPSAQIYTTRMHLDRRDIDNILIMEHYVNLEEVLKYSLEHT